MYELKANDLRHRQSIGNNHVVSQPVFHSIYWLVD